MSRVRWSPVFGWAILALCSLTWTLPGRAQTYDHPIEVRVRPLADALPPGASSALEITFEMPPGFLIGPLDEGARNPIGTRIEVAEVDGLEFGEPRVPPTASIGIPVHKGQAQAFTGITKILVPMKVSASAAAGVRRLRVSVTYTPSLDAGHLRTHAEEIHEVSIEIDPHASRTAAALPQPTRDPADPDFVVVYERAPLKQPLKTMLYQWKEGTTVPNIMHWLWIDPPGHGKHLQTAWLPFLTLSERSGNSFGLSFQLADATREGIMTGFFQLRAYHNEFNGNTIETKAISCPAAYFNYQFSAEISPGEKNRRLQFHMENLTLGDDDRFGFEVEAVAAHDPRSRFYGLGPGAKDENETNYSHEETGGFFDFYWLPRDKVRVGVGVVFRSVDVAEGSDDLHDEMPWTTDLTDPGERFANVPGIFGATVTGQRLLAVYDSRNSEFAPSAGFFGKISAGLYEVTDEGGGPIDLVDTYGRFTADLRHYSSTIDQKWTLVLRNSWTLTTSERIPFFDLAEFGGGFSDRGFITGRFYDQHATFVSVEIRRLIMPLAMLGIPMEVEMAPFVDAGQVFDDNGFSGVFNVNPGLSVRFLNKPNVGVVSNVALSQDGVVLTGGVQLPF